MLLVELAKALNRGRINYRIVGGYAVALHGAVRGTVDIDIVIDLNKKSFIQTEKILNSLGLVSRLPVSAIEVFDFREEYISNRNLIAWNFYNPEKPMESVDIIITDDASEFTTHLKKIAGVKVKLASIKDLITMKKQSGRKQDIEDIRVLEAIK